MCCTCLCLYELYRIFRQMMVLITKIDISRNGTHVDSTQKLIGVGNICEALEKLITTVELLVLKNMLFTVCKACLVLDDFVAEIDRLQDCSVLDTLLELIDLEQRLLTICVCDLCCVLDLFAAEIDRLQNYSLHTLLSVCLSWRHYISLKPLCNVMQFFLSSRKRKIYQDHNLIKLKTYLLIYDLKYHQHYFNCHNYDE